MYDVSKLVLSPIITQPSAQQQHRMVAGGGPTHYVVTPSLCWSRVRAVTTRIDLKTTAMDVGEFNEYGVQVLH